ncbi:MAG: hypothetical protein ACYSU4_16485, partial [Planctomycetota bacterium]
PESAKGPTVGTLGVFLLGKYCFSAYIGTFQLQRGVRILYEPVDFLTARTQKSSSYGWRGRRQRGQGNNWA